MRIQWDDGGRKSKCLHRESPVKSSLVAQETGPEPLLYVWPALGPGVWGFESGNGIHRPPRRRQSSSNDEIHGQTPLMSKRVMENSRC